MRGNDQKQIGVFSYVSLEERVAPEHPLRGIRAVVDEVFRGMNREFEGLYAATGRPSVPPERLLRALLLQIFYSVRSERMLMEQLDYNLLFRWFVGLEMDEPVWSHAVFSKNRDRLLNQEVARMFFARVLQQAQPHLSDEHFTVDGTLIEAWASQKSFQKKDGGEPQDKGAGANFHGEKRSNDTHESKTDPDARLFRKGPGKEAKLCHMGHIMMENNHGLIVDARLTEANGTAEREAALDMIKDNAGRGTTIGADKNYDTTDFVAGCRKQGCVPHVAQNNRRRRSAIDARTTRHAGYKISQIKRKRIEEPFGWMKTVGVMRKTRHRGRKLVEWFFVLAAAAYNLIRIPKILAAAG